MSDSLLDGYLHRRCGGRYAHVSETVTLRVSGMAATVERGFYRCDKCGDERRTVEQREEAEAAAVAAIRAEHVLLAPREIRKLRESLGLTHQQLGEVLYGIPRGIVEGWERGRYLQNPQVDALLRSLEDRETLERRAAKAGVQLPVPESAKPESATQEGAIQEGATPAAATPEPAEAEGTTSDAATSEAATSDAATSEAATSDAATSDARDAEPALAHRE